MRVTCEIYVGYKFAGLILRIIPEQLLLLGQALVVPEMEIGASRAVIKPDQP